MRSIDEKTLSRMKKLLALAERGAEQIAGYMMLWENGYGS